MKSWKTRWYGRIQKLLARLGLRLPGKIMYIGGSDTLPAPEAPEESAGDEAEPLSLDTLTVEAVVDWETAERMLTSLEDMSRWLKEALAEENCLVEEVAVTVNTAGGYTAQALAAGGVDVALLPAVDFIAWEEDAQALLVSGEDPCEIFRRVQFPVDEFFPPNSVSPKTATSYQEARSGCCGQ